MSSLLQLSADINRLFVPLRLDFSHSVFAGLTHLDMFETPLSENWVIGICSLLRLTHLSFNTDGVGLFAGETEIRYILANSKSLKALILIVADELALEDSDEYQDYKYFCDDPRSVVMAGATWDDWERGTTGGDDYWIWAERFIQKRRSGEIKGSFWYP